LTGRRRPKEGFTEKMSEKGTFIRSFNIGGSAAGRPEGTKVNEKNCESDFAKTLRG